MRKPIDVAIFLRSEPGQSRQKLGLLYGVASLSVADGILGLLNWDYGRSAVEKYNEI